MTAPASREPLAPLPGATVTIIVPVRNERRRIGECLASLLDQTYEPLEVIVVDDGSSDGTADVADTFPHVRVLRRAHAGKAAAVAAAADVATGDILFFLDGDMVFPPDYVTLMAAPIAAGEATGTAHAEEEVANPDNRWSRCWQRRAGLPPERRLALTPKQLGEGSVVYRAVRADAFRRVGGFDDVGYHDDQTLAPKLGRRAQWVAAARCRHYNVESLGEVAALGRWGAHDVWERHGRRALLSYAPPVAWARALAEAVRRRSVAMGIYDAAYAWGMWRGLLDRAGRR